MKTTAMNRRSTRDQQTVELPLPEAVAAERSLVGLWCEDWQPDAAYLPPDAFYDERWKAVAVCAHALAARGVPVNLETLNDELCARALLGEGRPVGSIGEVSACANHLALNETGATLAARIDDAWQRRRTIEAASALTLAAYRDHAATWQTSRDQVLRTLAPAAPPTAPAELEAGTPPSDRVAAFPLDTLPAEVQAFVRTAATALHCPVDYVAMPLLVYASAAIGTSACLEIKRGWREYARFWLAIVGDPGDKKSPALATVQRVIEERQRAHHTAWEAAYATWRQQDKAGEEPRLRQLYTSDATIEALGDVLHDNPRGVLVTRDELSGWALAMNEYKHRGADRQHWLALWSGGGLMVNRRSRNRPLYVEHPFVSVIGGIQPDVLGELCDERGRNDGFMHRLLFVYPDRKRRAWTDAEIADESYAPLRTLFDALYARPACDDRPDRPDPLVVTFTSRARDLWRDVMTDLYSEAEARDFPDVLRGPWAKLEGYIARLALVIHLSRAAFDATVRDTQCDEKSLGAAADIADYLKSHLRRVYARLIARPEDVRLLHIIAWIREHGGTCSARDLYRAGVAGITTADAADTVLGDIVSRGWGRTVLAPNAHGPATLRLTLHDPTQDTMTGGET